MLALGLFAAPAGIAAPPGDFQTSLVVGDGLDGPSGFEIAPDGRIFILERSGKIKIVKNGQLLPTPFADLPSEDTGDRGLIGIAFDPDFGVVQPLRLLLLHRARPAEPPGPVQRGRRRRHRRPVRAVQDLVAVAAAARRRQHPVRAGRQAVLRGRRQRLRAERPGPEQSAREDPADQQGRLDPGRQPVRRPARQAGRDLGVRIPQPVALPVRQRHRAALRRRRGRLQLGGGQPHRQGRQLRLAAARGHVHVELRRLHRPDLHLSA